MKKILALMLTITACVLLFTEKAAASNNYADIDANNANNGYISVKVNKDTNKTLKVKISKDGQDYIYLLPSSNKFHKFPLQMDSGTYAVKILENIEGNKYSVLYSDDIKATINDPLTPFKNSHVLINYEAAPNTVAVAKELTAGSANELEKLSAIYQNIIERIKYDSSLASKIVSGAVTSYVPDVDAVYASKKGICFDYASVMASMLRSQGVPTRLVMGYVAPKNLYHAWNEVFIHDVGWVKVRGEIYFDGAKWSRMDSTFAAGNGLGDFTKFIGNGSNYKATGIY